MKYFIYKDSLPLQVNCYGAEKREISDSLGRLRRKFDMGGHNLIFKYKGLFIGGDTLSQIIY